MLECTWKMVNKPIMRAIVCTMTTNKKINKIMKWKKSTKYTRRSKKKNETRNTKANERSTLLRKQHNRRNTVLFIRIRTSRLHITGLDMIFLFSSFFLSVRARPSPLSFNLPVYLSCIDQRKSARHGVQFTTISGHGTTNRRKNRFFLSSKKRNGKLVVKPRERDRE